MTRGNSRTTTPSRGQPGQPPAPRRRECTPTEIANFSRNNYFTGKLLTERELTAEQRYHVDKLRLHNLGLHGWGAVCGLKVRPHEHCPALRVVVEPGFAVDGAGREVLVRAPLDVPLPPRPAAKKTGEETPPDEYPPVPQHCPETSELYVRIRYVECDSEFTPAPFDECACNGDSQKPSRIIEGHEVEVLTEKPADWDDIVAALEVCGVDECDDLYGRTIDACPPRGWPLYIPLAVISGYAPGAKVTEVMIDNHECRPILPSTRALDGLIRCILDKLPARTTTRIRDFNWNHRGSYDCGDFLSQFVHSHDGPRDLYVAFSQPVLKECLTSQVFQVTVVRHEKGHEGGFLEVVPATVWTGDDGTTYHLRIDRAYAERCLRGSSFDVYVTLRCDAVLDASGVPVDGNLQLRLQGGEVVTKKPTGDGVPGGTFESWFRVHPRHSGGSV